MKGETTSRAGRAALLGLALTATLVVGGALGYRVATASLGVTDAVARNLQPAAERVRPSAIAAEAVPRAENAPNAAEELPGEQRLREFKDAFGNAWREGMAQAATGPAATPSALAEPPTPSPPAVLPSVPVATATTPVAEVPLVAAEAAAPTPSATATPIPTTTETAPPSAAPTTSASVDSSTVTAAPGASGTVMAPPVVLAAVAVDAGPKDLRVIVYSAAWCSACQDAKTWMTAAGIPFEERDIDSSPEYMQQLKSLNRRMSIPTFDIDGKAMVGFYPRQLVWMLQRAVLRRAAGVQ